MNHYSARRALLVVCVALFCVGCEHPPALTTSIDPTPVSANVVSSSGRGGYDWYRANGAFEITAPAELEVLSQIDLQLLKSNLQRLNTEDSAAVARPDGMDEDVFYTIRRVAELYPESQPLLTIPFQPAANGMFAVDPTGHWLAMISTDLVLWDLKERKRVSNVALPSKKCFRLLWDSDRTHVIVLDDSSLYKIEPNSGKVLNTWPAPEGDSLVFMDRASVVDAYAVSTKNGRLYALGKDFVPTQEFKAGKLDRPEISMHPNAKWVLCFAEGNTIRWHISDARQGKQTAGPFEPNRAIVAPVAANLVDAVVEPLAYTLYIDNPTTGELQTDVHEANPLTHATCAGTVDHTQDWLTSCMSRPDSSGTRQYFLQDVHPASSTFSLPFPLGSTPVLEIAADQLTELCVVRDASGLRVYERQRWKENGNFGVPGRLTQLAVDGRFEQLEMAAELLRRRSKWRNIHGENLYLQIAASTGSKWADLELGISGDEQTNKPILAKLDKWRAAKSELAILASAFRHFEAGLRARGTDYASAVSSQDWMSFQKRNERIRAEIRPLVNLDVPSLAALRLAILSELKLGSSVEEIQPLIKKQIEHYPHTPITHVDVCIHLLPRWGGAAGEAGAYISSVADLMPQPEADLFFVRVASSFTAIYVDEVLSASEGGINRSRLLRSIETTLRTDSLGREDTEFLMRIAQAASRRDLTNQLVDYHVNKFTFNQLHRSMSTLQVLLDKRLSMSKQ